MRPQHSNMKHSDTQLPRFKPAWSFGQRHSDLVNSSGTNRWLRALDGNHWLHLLQHGI
jgi:hypothetical protein